MSVGFSVWSRVRPVPARQPSIRRGWYWISFRPCRISSLLPAGPAPDVVGPRGSARRPARTACILHTAGSRTRQPRTPPIEDRLSVPALPPGRRVTSPHLVALPRPSVRFSGVPHPARKGFECTRPWHRRLPHLPRLKPDGSTYVSDGRASPVFTGVWRKALAPPHKAGQRALISLRSALVSAVAVVQPQSVARLPAGVSTTRGHLGVAPLPGFSNACRWLRAERRLSSRAHR